ncbi:MAG: MBG domain-containing protein [Limisphaerales bacterium]
MQEAWVPGKSGIGAGRTGLAFAAAALLLSASSQGQSVTLAWDPSTSPEVSGYNLYYGGASQTYTNMVAVGGATNATVSGLLPGARYFFAVTAIDISGLESDFSNEISYQVQGTQGVPGVLVVTAANQWRTYGAANPALTGTVTGLQNGDDITATFGTSATPGSPVGTYAIVPSLSDPDGELTNYNVTINNGTLTILPAATVALVTSSANPSLPGGTVTFTTALGAVAPGAGIPTGTVQFLIDGAVAGSPAPLGGGTATYTASALGHGTHTVAAQYAGDGNFAGTTGLLASPQVVDTPPVPGPCAITYDPTTGTKLPLATLLSKASDADGDAIALAGMAAASANGGSVSCSGGWVFYVPAPGFTNADTFSYAISDGYGAPVTGAVTLNLRGGNGSSANLVISGLGNSSYAISGSGVPARLYQVRFTDGGPSSNWQALGEALADPNGCFGFIDPNGSPQRLYQTLCP